jgi:D-beta-D-heptose 7-phosphate kinase/D-beta-D-heptose 1-phosphate adenosyltransferase
MGRVLAPTAFLRAARTVQRSGGRVVFTNGVFDLLHYGHVAYLERARRLGDALFVAVNTDRSTRLLKGATRPLVPQQDRLRTLAALGCVDFVTAFDEATPEALIAKVRPDVLVKGADYRLREIVGADAVRSWGGKVARVPLLKGRSTSALVARIRRGH